MRTFRIAVMPGDGIGPEVIGQARRVLAECCGLFGFHCELTEGLIGQAALEAAGRMMPPETLRLAREVDAVLLGPVGGSRWEHPTHINHPKQAVVNLRSWLGTYATLRPIKHYASLNHISPLKRPGLDLLVVYDHSSGLYYGQPRGIEQRGDERVATNTEIYTSREVRRAARMAFEAAAERKGRLASVDESKVLETGELWRDEVEAMAAERPEIAFRRLDADNFLFELVTHPAQFDVVLSEMVVGQLIAITAAGLTGSYAIHPVAYLGGQVGIYQPGHGAAPDLQGKDEANPIAAIRAVAMMLDHSFDGTQRQAARAIEQAVAEVLDRGFMPKEVCPSGRTPMSTPAMGDAVIAALREVVAQQRGEGVVFEAAEPGAEERERGV